jgi:hypothetical protein
LCCTIPNNSHQLNSLQRQIHFIASLRKKVLVGLTLCVFLSFVIIVLEPFDTDQFEADHRFLLLSGYGILIFVVYVIQGSIENIWYARLWKVWTVRHEIIATIIFLLFSGHVLYLYNTLVVNLKSPSPGSYMHFLFSTVISMIPVFVPLMLYLRQQFGEKIVPSSLNSITLTGENKKEILRLEKEDLLFIRAVENYVEICFMDKNKKAVSKTFRQTLSNVCEQAPFLEKCHRSYLVNLGTIKEIIGNSQSAKIVFVEGEKEIPLSKTYYKDIKSRLG